MPEGRQASPYLQYFLHASDVNDLNLQDNDNLHPQMPTASQDRFVQSPWVTVISQQQQVLSALAWSRLL